MHLFEFIVVIACFAKSISIGPLFRAKRNSLLSCMIHSLVLYPPAITFYTGQVQEANDQRLSSH